MCAVAWLAGTAIRHCVRVVEPLAARGQLDEVTRRIDRSAQLVATSIYVGFVAVATPLMGLGTRAGEDNTLLDITSRVATLLALLLTLSAVLSQFSTGIADTAAAGGNLRKLSGWMRGPRPCIASAAYYARQAVVALRTSRGFGRKLAYAARTPLMILVAVLAEPAG